jgi:branched-chain amino acid transport system substrate-binding protein
MAIRSRKIWTLATTAAMVAALAACGSDDSNPSAGSEDVPDEILIGGIHPRTGPSSYYGLPMDQGVELAIKEINDAGGISVGDKSVKLRYATEDDKSDASAGVAALKKLTTDGADFIIGPLGGAVVQALKPIIESSDTLLLIDGAADPTKGLLDPPGMFRWPPSYASMDESLTTTVEDLGFDSVAILNDQANPSFANSVEGVADSMEEAGVKVVGTETFSTGDSDFRAQLTGLLAGDAPDAITVRGYALDATLATAQARELGYKGQLIWEVLAPPATVSANAPAEALEGVIDVIYATPDFLVKQGDEKAIAFTETYTAEFGEAPGSLSAYSYDVVKSLAAAIEDAGSVDPTEVGKALGELKLADLELVNGYVEQENGRLFDETGQAENVIVTMTWRDGDWFPLES